MEQTPSPSSLPWSVEIDKLGEKEDDKQVLYATIKFGEQVVGMVRLPSLEHLEYLRGMLSNEHKCMGCGLIRGSFCDTCNL